MSSTATQPTPDSFEESAQELYERAPCGYVSTHSDGRIARVNRTFADWSGYTKAELTGGMRFSDLLTVGGRIFYETHCVLMLRMYGRVDEIAFDMSCKDGGTIPTLVTGTQQRDGAGNALLNRYTIFNATERRSYERELVSARRRAEEASADLARVNTELAKSNAALLKANEELAQFAFIASHDLQEPLRTITAYVQLLARRYVSSLDDDAKTFVGYIVDGAARMQILINDLLAFSRAEASDLILRPVQMTRALEVALTNLQSSVNETGSTVSHDELPTVQADAARMVQVFQNLVANSIKYRKPREPARVHISAVREQAANCWRFKVEDNGIGFDPQYSDQIFGMFKRLHGTAIPGTGIGLAICKKIIESHGGTIWARSTPDVGSAFFFTIPDTSAL